MPKVVPPLTDTAIKALKPSDKKRCDGANLYIIIEADSSKWWRYDYTRPKGGRNSVSFGDYPTITLAKARELAKEAKTKLKSGIDISEERKEDKRQKSVVEDGQIHLVVKAFLLKIKESLALTTYEHTARRFERDILPFFSKYKQGSSALMQDIISSTPMNEIRHSELLKAILAIESRGAVNSSHRALAECNRLWLFAVQHEYCDNNIISNIDKRHALKKAPKKHFASTTDSNELKRYIEFANGFSRGFSTRYALKLLPYVFLRAGNIRTLEWSEVDFNKKLLIIKADKMKVKSNGDFTLPLCKEAIAVLQEIQPFTTHSKYVFPHAYNKSMPMSDNAMSKVLRDNGFRDIITPHGFRSVFSSLAYENSHVHGLSHKVIEACLHHGERNKIAGAYNYQANYVEQMRLLMDWWGDYLNNLIN